MDSDFLSANKKMVGEMFDSLVPTIGIHVALLVIEHALWKTKRVYEEAALIQFSEQGINLDQLDCLEPEKVRAISQDFTKAIITTLGRLVGVQLVRQLTEQLQIEQELM